MSLTVCTGWAPAGFEEYGRRFVETFAKHWPQSVRLIVYGEEPVPLPRGEMRPLSSIPGAAEFRARHKDSKAANGRDPKPSWKPSWRAAGYNYRFDAWKFSPQGFIPWHAAQDCGTEFLCWLDGDVIALRDIDPEWLTRLLPDSYAAAYLGRVGMHSEIGFQLYRLPHAMRMLERFAEMYATDEVFSLTEWHSAYVWDHVRKTTGAPCHNLTPRGTGHVWCQSPLGVFMDHTKGARKKLGYSPERGALK